MTTQDPPPGDGQPPVDEPEIMAPPGGAPQPDDDTGGPGGDGAPVWSGPAPVEAQTADPAGATGWAEPPPARRSRGLWVLVGFVVVILILVIGCAGLVFVGGQVQKILAGTVEFGASEATGCGVGQRGASFPAGTSVHVAGHLTRTVQSGEVVTITISKDGAVLSSGSQAATASGDCMIGALPANAPSGRYRIEYRIDSDVLASGEFEIKP